MGTIWAESSPNTFHNQLTLKHPYSSEDEEIKETYGFKERLITSTTLLS